MQNIISNLRRKTPLSHMDSLLHPCQKFLNQEAAGGVVLLICAAIALIWSNSPLEGVYNAVWHSHFTVGFPRFFIDEPLHFWIDDALMAIFFFVVGLEIKRSLFLGELSSVRQAALPVVSALGGMVVPAAIYIALNGLGGEAGRGWGIPMSTDIAFSLGVLALLGTRVPLSLKIFLTAFAIVDDIGVIIVIAVFFTETIHWANLGIGIGLIILLMGLNRMGVRNMLVYLLISIVVWVSFFESGIHATVAGVLVAITIPLKVEINPREFVARGRSLLDIFESEGTKGARRGQLALTTETQRAALENLETAAKQVDSPLQRIEHMLHPWVSFAIMPLFALANAHVSFDSSLFSNLASPVSMGIILGLVIGKPLGITLFSWVAVKSGAAFLPDDVGWRQIVGTALLGGIGFTMSIFVTGLAFSDEALISQAKIGILIASVIAGFAGYLILRSSAAPSEKE